MESKELWIKIPMITAIVLAGLLPIVLFWVNIGNVPTVDSEEARRMLTGSDSDALLIDVRESGEFDNNHIHGAVNWPFSELMSTKSSDSILSTIPYKSLLLICENGIWSAMAVRRLKDQGVKDVYNVRGGITEWIAPSKVTAPVNLFKFKAASGEIGFFSNRNSPLLEQWSAVVVAFFVKPFYMLFSLGLIIIIFRLKSPDMVALTWGLIFFLSGEIFCAVNYIFFEEKSYLMEYLHIYGMVLCFGSVTYAFMEGVDLRIIKYSDPAEKCGFMELCGTCVKYTDTHCEMRRVFLFMIPLFFTLCFMPILSDLHGVSYNTVILGTNYNYSHAVIYQIFEIRIAPVMGALLFAASFIILLIGKEHQVFLPKLLFAGGIGFFGFSMFRLVIFKIYRDNLAWFVVSEEVTELLFVLWIGAILWFFRGKIFKGGEVDGVNGIGRSS